MNSAQKFIKWCRKELANEGGALKIVAKDTIVKKLYHLNFSFIMLPLINLIVKITALLQLPILEMEVLIYLIPIALLLGIAGLVAFLWSLKNILFEYS